MKKTIKKALGIIFSLLALAAPAYALAVNVTVPSAPGNGYALVSTTTGAYIATTTSPLHVGSLFATSTTQTSSFLGGLTVNGTITTGVTGTNNNCLQVNTSGVVSGTGSACGGSGGTGLSTTSPISAGNVLEYSSAGAGSAFGIATGTLAGTANQIAISATAYTLLNGATLSFPQSLIFPLSFTSTYGTTTYASSTALTSTQLFSTNATTSTLAITGALGANCNGTSALTTNSSGTVNCTAQPQGTVTAVSVATANGFAGTSGGGATPALTLTTTITGLLKGNGTAISAAALTDFPTQAANTFVANGTGATAAPTALASTSIFTASTGQVIYASATGGLVGTSTIFIDTNGRVGIASTTLNARLSVGGLSGVASSSILVAPYRYGGANEATSTTKTLDCRTANTIQYPISTSALTLTLGGIFPGTACKIIIENPNGGTAGTITWAAPSGSILLWAGGTTPTQTTTANKQDVWSFIGTQGSSTNVILGAQTANF